MGLKALSQKEDDQNRENGKKLLIVHCALTFELFDGFRYVRGLTMGFLGHEIDLDGSQGPQPDQKWKKWLKIIDISLCPKF